jgi:hypothetical protein
MRWTRRLALAAAGAASLLLVTCAPAAGASGSGGALVVGDSLEVLTSPYLKQYLPGVPLTVNAEGGYNSIQIRELFEESYDPTQSVIVFDAGTDDNPAYPQILAENLTSVAAQIGDRCMVVPTIHGLTVNGIGNDGKNRVVAEFAASRPGTQVPDWARAAATHPELMQSDDLHPVPAGADLRARLIARGVRGCLAFMTGATASREREPRVPRPQMKPVGEMIRRESELGRAIATALGGRLAVKLLGQVQPLGALTMTALAAASAAVQPETEHA